ncbi:hypothetical protein EJ06DRAFT_512670 [Trichodelitschia bisporula]|uniref:Elongation factor 1 alpha-like protein n=1 Tax=Trichodelitschia bisporula TaxID=703511 RepID=A0A6G1HRF4_9PEZI|nr:hypothetical protein EJ06DRAFT_512670 [Trichodelitschia bisporula]
MSHRRVKGVSYDGDYDGDDYDDDGGDENVISPEDREQLRLGAVEVRRQLGDVAVTDKEVLDALWYYYFDTDKTVSYLKNLRKPTPKPATKKPKEKKETPFDKAAAAAQKNPVGEPLLPKMRPPEMRPTYCPPETGRLEKHRKLDRARMTFPLPFVNPLPASAYFDIPLGKVPRQLNANLIHMPMYPPGGLLGGAPPKVSKLAALAAAKKKKIEEEKKVAAPAAPATDRAIALLDRLTLHKENAPGSSVSLRSVPLPEPAVQQRPKRASSPSKEPAPDTKRSKPTEAPRAPRALSAAPSSFAMALFVGRPPVPDVRSPNQQAGSMFSPCFSYTSELFAEHNPFAGPSPDDIVLNAQKGAKGKATKGNAAKQEPDLAQGVAELALEGSPKKHKNLNVVEEYKKANMKHSASFVVIGHVDHGKSTLMGRLLLELGAIDTKAVDKLRHQSKKAGKASFALAWVMDSTPDERSRGVTVDVATNYFETPKTRFTILDAPGHRDFIPNMIAGASQADFAVLVVDAGTNSFESGLRGQTKEHALLVRSLGVTRLVVAVNKMDMANWAEERFTEISQQLSAFLTAAGFAPKNVSFIPVAGLRGDNIAAAPTAPEAAWYKGPTLVAALDAAEPSAQALEAPLRLTVAEVFRQAAHPTSIAGRIDSGTMQPGDALVIAPSGATATVRAIDIGGKSSAWAVAGQIAVVHLGELEGNIKVGDVACAAGAVVQVAHRFTVKILAFEHVLPMFVDVMRGTAGVAGRVAGLVATLDKASGAVVRKKPRVVPPGQVARVTVVVDEGVPLEVGWRVVLRAEGQSVAAGLVEGVEE